MPNRTGPTEPSRPTVKRLFAVSGNRCAFPRCSTALVDPTSGSIVGEICHIEGEKPRAARYNRNQTAKDRQSFDNVLLLCNVHHKIVDDDETKFTVGHLVRMKKNHERNHKSPPSVDQATTNRFITKVISNCRIHGPVVTSHAQAGGQTANVINNYSGITTPDEEVRLDGKLEIAADLRLIQATGCPGMKFTAICRSRRPAKIKSASLHVEGKDFLKGFQVGFNHDFGHTPVDGSTETLSVRLVPLSPPNSPEGYVLNRDDVCRFFYPLPTCWTLLALRAKPEDVSLSVKFFDGSDRTILTGREIQNVLEGLFQVFKDHAGQFKGELSISVRADSKTLPNLEMMGQLNPNYAPIVQREPVTDSPKTPQRNRAKRQSDSRTGLKQRMRGGGNSANPKRTRKSAKPVKKSTRSR